jgi:hypothetical protein
MMDQVRLGLTFQDDTNAQQRHEQALEVLKLAIAEQQNAPLSQFGIFHGARDGEYFRKCRFRLWVSWYYAKSEIWTDQEKDLDVENSQLVVTDGTGKTYIEKHGKDWIDTGAKGTSRAAIWSFCDALRSGQDQYSGGPPQLVGLWRKGGAKIFGFLWDQKAYLSGADLPLSADFSCVQWFNDNFERCDGITGELLNGAKRQDKLTLTSPT